jgi:hypothetical protein
MWQIWLLASLIAVNPVSADDIFGITGGNTSRLWMSSPYLDHQTHKAIIAVLRDAGYDVHDHTPPEMNPNKPPLTSIVLDATGRYYEIGAEPVRNPPFRTLAADGFSRRNGVVNGYDYRSRSLGVSPRDYFEDLKRNYSYDMDIKALRQGGLLATPKQQGYSITDLHTFAAAPQNDASAVLNHLYRSVLQTAEKQGYNSVRIEFERQTGEIRFRIR